MSVQLAGGMAYTSRRARWKRARRVVIPVAAALAAVSAFLAWGPVGVGPGPIGNGVSRVSFADPVPRTQPAMFLAPIDAGRSGAVIDSMVVLSDGSYPAPHVISIKGDREQACGGTWPLTGRQNFYRVCAVGGLVPLLGRAVPAKSRVDVPGLGPVTYTGVSAAIKVAPPGPAGCWMATSIVIHYHVGIRHYAATDAISVTACSSKSQLEAVQEQR